MISLKLIKKRNPIQYQQISDASFSGKYGQSINWLVTYDRADTFFLYVLGSSVI